MIKQTNNNGIGRQLPQIQAQRDSNPGARTVQPVLVENQRSISAGAISQVSGLAGVETISLTMDNTTAAAVNYMVGDASGVGAAALAALGLTGSYSAPVCQDIAYSVINKTLESKKMEIIGLNYRVKTSDTQFGRKHSRVSGRFDGALSVEPLKFSHFQSPSDQNNKVRVIDLSKAPVVLGSSEGMIFNVAAGETVTVDLIVGRYIS
jgi:hypothetical protein